MTAPATLCPVAALAQEAFKMCPQWERFDERASTTEDPVEERSAYAVVQQLVSGVFAIEEAASHLVPTSQLGALFLVTLIPGLVDARNGDRGEPAQKTASADLIRVAYGLKRWFAAQGIALPADWTWSMSANLDPHRHRD